MFVKTQICRSGRVVALAVAALCVLAMGSEARAQSNVIVIISDDAGYADFGFMNGLSGETSEVPTPNLDALAARGVTFSNAYTAMVCSPSRAAIATGGYQQRVGYEFNINNLTSATGPFEGLPVETDTVWEYMKPLGHTTGAVGKWHIGSIADTSPTEFGNRPQRQGVDEFRGLWRGSRNYNVGGQTNETRVLRETTVDQFGNVTDTVIESLHNGEYITNTFGQFSVDFIADHAGDTEPFFLYHAFTAPHGPFGASPDINDPSLSHLSGGRKNVASMVLTMDKEIGRMMDALEDPNDDGNTSDSILDDTLVIFINDNGGVSSGNHDNGQFRDFKGSPYEGGIRVPMIIAGAGVNPSVEGTVYDGVVHSIDILPTSVAAGGGNAEGQAGIDGVNLLPYINGTNTSAPHESIVVRLGDELGLRKGDWKLVKNGSGNSFELYNLSTDISETTNVAGANPAVVAELQRDLTEYESEFDKPRFAELNSSQNTINIFDHFLFRPGQGGAVPGPNVVANSGFENGQMIDGSSYHTFEELDDWSNNNVLTSPDKDEVAARNDNAFAGAYRGLIAGDRTPFQVTGHTIALGEEFTLSLATSGQFSQWDVGLDSIDAQLFYLDGSTVVVLETINIVPTGSWAQTNHNFSAINDANAVGKQLGIRFDSTGGNSEFAGLDEIHLGLTSASPTMQLNWSASDAWYEGGTTNSETMFTSDSFAGAVLEFPTLDTGSYTATNDMTRMSGLEYMLNQILLSGSFGGASNQSGTLDGNDVVLTDALDGTGPSILITASNGGGGGPLGELSDPGFTYEIDMNLLMFDDLRIAGGGNVAVNINGDIRDYDAARSLTKDDASVVTLKGNNTYAGNTTVAGGTLALADAGTLANTALIDVRAGGTFDVSATTSGGFSLGAGQTLSGSGVVIGDIAVTANATLAPGQNGGGGGTLTINGNVSVVDSTDYALWRSNLSHGSVSATGTAAINGALSITQADEMALGTRETILTSAGLTGTFDHTQITGYELTGTPNTAVAVLYTATDVELLATYEGDANGDGIVNPTDLAALTLNWLGSDRVWQSGDFNYDGVVNPTDLALLTLNWLNDLGLNPEPATVPEPAGLVLLGLGAVAIVRRRR